MAVSNSSESSANNTSEKGKKKKPLWKRILKKAVLTLTILIAIIGIAIGVALYTVFTPKRITPIVLDLANDYLDAEVSCESVELTFFSSFPYLGVVLKNGMVVKPLRTTGSPNQEELAQDTLVAFRQCRISFNPVAFLSDGKIIINSLRLVEPNIYAYVNEDGLANWDILLQSDTAIASDTVTVADTIHTKPPQMPELNIKGIRITDAHIIYDDRAQDVFAAVDSLNLRLDGNMSKDSSMLDLAFEMKTATVFYEGQSMIKQLPLKIKAQLHNNRITRKLTLEQASVTAGVLAFNASGTLQGDTVRRQAMVDMEFGLSSSSLSDLLEMIPGQVSDINERLLVSGEMDFHGQLNGYIGKGSTPILTASAHLTDGSLRSKKRPELGGIKKIELNGDAHIDLTKQTASHVRINKFIVQTASSAIDCSGKLSNIFTQPAFDARVEADINFNRLSQDLLLEDSMQMGGMIKADLSGNGFVDDIITGDYGKIAASGKLDIDDVIFRHPKEEIDIFASLVKLRLGSNSKDSIRGRVVESLLRGGFEADSISLKYGSAVLADLGKLSAGFFTTAPKDSGSVAVLVATVGIENLSLNTEDSIRARALKTRATLRLTPSAENKSRPELSAQIAVESLRGRMPELGGRINNAVFKVKLKKQADNNRRAERSGRLRRSSDSTNVRTRRADSTRRQNQASYMSFRLESDDARKILRNIDISGTLECRNMNLRTPVFPLPIRMTESSIGFTTGSLSLNRTHLKVGESDMVLTGEVTGINRALLRNGKITAKVSIESDMVDCNQLLRAFAAGSEYAEKDTEQRDSIAQVILDDSKELAQLDTSALAILVIPRNIDFELNTKLKKVTFNNLLLDRVSGKIHIHNQSIQLSELLLGSDIGSANLSLAYKTPDTKGANLGMDLKMDRIQIKELISIFPMIDTLAPMLRSFEGVVDCEMTAIAQIDSLWNIILPQTSASCYLKGESLVLMDSETFADIAKMLMFKNKKRNMIDSISVEMVLENNELMVFPFQLAIDRYIAGVGGVQYLDMSFDYHISVLKSPVPFKLGLNISGTPDKFKFRLAKAKYKDMFTPTKKKSLESVQINLRQEMEKSLRKSIDEIVSTPLASPMRRPRLSLDDSLRREYFQLDTTRLDTLSVEPGAISQLE